MYCPNCKSEYRDGFTFCSDCNINLVKQLPEHNADELVAEEFVLINPTKVTTVSNELEAKIMMNIFLNNNIPCFKMSKGAGEYMNLYMGYSIFGEDIYVDEEDYEKALDLLNEFSENEEINEELIEEDISPDNYPIPLYRNSKILARILIAFIILVIAISTLMSFLQ